MRRGGVLLTVWLVVAGLAIAVGTWALSLVGGEISNQTIAPMSDSQIGAKLRADRSGDDSVAGNAQPSGPRTVPTASGLQRLDTRGGTINAWCVDGLPHLYSWSPKTGYRYDEDSESVHPGPVTSVTVKFEAEGQATLPEVVAQVTCLKNVPRVAELPRSSTPPSSTTATTPDQPAPSATDDRGGSSGGHGADDGSTDDHHRRGAGSGGSGGADG